jgi:hypothetical protein
MYMPVYYNFVVVPAAIVKTRRMFMYVCTPAIWWRSMKLQCGSATETDGVTVYIRWAYCLLRVKRRNI